MTGRTAHEGVRRILLLVLCAMPALGTVGCGDLLAEKICGGGQYPVIRGDGAGGSCLEDGEEPTGANVHYPAHRVPDLADEDYSPTLGDYLSDGSERQQAIARKQLQRLREAYPNKSRQDLVDGPIFPSGYPPEGERP